MAFRSFLSSYQVLMERLPSLVSSYFCFVRHYSLASPVRYMVAVVTMARGFFLIYVTVVWRHPKEKAAYNISIIW